MTPHWTECREELRQWLLANARILIGCDFDGTLSPIVDHAMDAQVLPATQRALERLAALRGVSLAIITGRSLADVRRRLDLPGALYAGNHGLEMLTSDGARVLAPGVEAARGQLQAVLAGLTPRLSGVEGVWVEDKQLTASVHYRLALVHQHDLVERAVKSALQGAPGLELRQGKCIWEIRPAGDWNKGSALRCFMEKGSVPECATAFLGDDVTDLDAFRAIPDGWTFIVGEAVEIPARARLRHPEDVALFLDWMAEVRRAVL